MRHSPRTAEQRSQADERPIVIVVEDDAGLAELIKRSLRRALGASVSVAHSGTDGIALAREHRGALVITDYALPDMSGADLVQVVLEEDLGCGFIVITGRGDERVAVEMMKAGARDYLVKDASFLDRLPTATERVLQNIERDRRLEQAEKAQKEMEAQLLQSQKLEAIGTLAGGVAHEINNPINGIMNYAQLIMDKVDGHDDALNEYAAEIISETERIATIVRSLLGFARRDDASGHVRTRPADVVMPTLTFMETVLKHDQITLTVDIADDLPTIRCQTKHLQQVVMNLVANAREALNEKYPTFNERKRISVSAQMIEHSGDVWVRLTVEDLGPGIPDDALERIFEPFFTTKKPDKGTGIGLSISHGIVRKHGGKLHVETEPGQWTRFHVDLPIDVAHGVAPHG